MLSTAAQPMQPSRLLATIVALFTRAETNYGSATYTVGADRQLIHDQTELSFQPGPKETPEAFIDRVRSQGEEGDVIEFGMRDGRLVTGKITRRAAVPIRLEAGETLESFVARVQTYKGSFRIPQA